MSGRSRLPHQNYRNFSDSPTSQGDFVIQTDLLLYSAANLLLQAESADEYLGYKILSFYVDEAGLISNVKTEQCATFYLSPSGGTLRDTDMNIVLYSAKFDKFKGLGRI